MNQLLADVLGGFFAAAAEGSQVGIQTRGAYNRQPVELARERQRKLGGREKLDPGALLDLAQD